MVRNQGASPDGSHAPQRSPAIPARHPVRCTGIRYRGPTLDRHATGRHLSVGEALARHREVSFAAVTTGAVTTGAANLVAAVNCRDPRDLGRYLTERIAELPGIATLETAPIIRTVKRSGSLLV
ncbi:Lrp/AsnC ligand binding domain-containing protein [Nocardia sp. CA-135953]|uniref:Lrp/AsnC ligand binding domain-containing protein n=1 Tax=Nocardia sp. CA-135953 TaxID=3239978 RepID=UPI003D9717B4